MSTHTDEDRVILKSLDFEPPCEHSNHEHNGDGPAAWIIRFALILECGCECGRTALWCVGCKNAILSRDFVRCNFCHGFTSPSANVLHIESLR